MPKTHVVFFASSGLAQDEAPDLDDVWQHEATTAFFWQQERGRSCSIDGGMFTPCSMAQASFCSRVKQQQSFQQLSALMQPQARCAQGNGLLRSFSLGRVSGKPKQAIA